MPSNNKMKWLLKPLKRSQSGEGSVDYWEKKLKKAEVPQDYAPFLLSHLDISHKARLIYRINLQKGLPDNLFGHQEEVERLATVLDQSGEKLSARLLRFFQFHTQPPDPSVLTWCQSLLEIERRVRRIVQALIFLEKRLEWGRNALTYHTSDLEHRRKLESQLKDTEKHHKRLEVKYVQCRSDISDHRWHMPSGLFHRAFVSWRYKPNYECLSHCTEFCPYCLATNGLSPSDHIPDIDVKVEEDPVKFNVIYGQDLYSRRVYRAYIWGVDIINDIED
ncbi:hypothetical protein CFD26_104886 [Aspergillus turcosus]|uniref:Uncharacterized protein n=1 Tax=Aspergillus turcosus TaxID=1245748 RepID=A0A421D6N0_9EURO|nr:hypothetical protein CFD26_104886 [Aspergillus turcosus]